MPWDQGAMPDTLNLLIVEDSDAERALLAAELAACPGLAPRMAASLHDAADAIATAPPDVVLLDLELPDARGLNGVEWLQRHHPALAVVVLSGFAADDLLVATEAIRQGAQDFLCKGRIEADRLHRTLRLAVERKAREHRLVQGVVRDPLTGLPWLPQLEERFDRSVARNARNRAPLALLHIAIDDFASLRETHGIDRAEAALVEFARRLARLMRRTDAVAKCDDTTFVALVDGMKHISDAYVVARKVVAAAREPIQVGDATMCVRPSIGVVTEAGPDLDFRGLLARAETAMYEARRQGGDRYAAAAELLPAAG